MHMQRADVTLHLIVAEVIPDYQRTALRLEFGLQRVQLHRHERLSKDKADAVSARPTLQLPRLVLPPHQLSTTRTSFARARRSSRPGFSARGSASNSR